jgi:hypothetical protein
MKDLTAQARVLADRVGGLSDAVEQLDRRTNRGEKVVIGVIVGLTLDLILSIVVGVVLIQLQGTTQIVSETQAREARTRQDSLCPLYRLILGTYNPDSRPEGDARQTYIDQFKIMREAYAALDCAGPLVPPAAPR